MTRPTAKSKPESRSRKPEAGSPEAPVPPPKDSPISHEEFLASIRKAHTDARPVNYFRQWPTEYLIEAGLPRDWMEKCGLVKSESAAGIECPTQCSLRQFAAFVSEQLGTRVDKMKVQEACGTWLKPARTDKNGKPNANGSLSRDAAFKLWQENIGGSKESAMTLAEYKREQARIDMEESAARFEEYKRETSGKWLLFASVKSYVNGMAARGAGILDRLIEDKDGLRKIVRAAAARCGATEEFILRADAELARDFAAANDSILKVEFARIAAAADKHFKEQHRAQMKQNL